MAAAPMQRPRDRFLPIAVGIGLVAILAALVLWLWPHGASDIQRQRVIQEITVVQPPPPPPPPPEPEEKIMEEQEVIQPAETPEVQKPVEKPAEAPSETAPAAQAAGLDRPADAGSDSFRLSAGGGGGLFGRAAVAAAEAGAVSWKGIFVAPCSAIPARGRRRASCA